MKCLVDNHTGRETGLMHVAGEPEAEIAHHATIF